MNKNIECVFDFIRSHTIEEIAHFDIKNLWETEMIEYTTKKMKNEVSKKYEIGEITPLKKICCYKIAANELGIDCDTSLFTMVIFRLLFPISGTHLERQPYQDQKYQLTGLNFTCIGDTMNSYATATRNYIKTHYQNKAIYSPDRKGYLKWEYQNVSRINYWEAAILDHYRGIEKILPSYINSFLKLIHTIGNMIPVPINCFNVPRNQKTNDYWDITLEGMYQNNFEKIIGPSTRSRWSRKENVENCQIWFSNYNSWKDFVEKTFMQSFVDQDLKPIELCKKKKNRHSKRIPTDEVEYEKFYTNVTNMILKRGIQMASLLKDLVENTTNEQLIKHYFKDIDFVK